jgi:hypothetical protein
MQYGTAGRSIMLTPTRVHYVVSMLNAALNVFDDVDEDTVQVQMFTTIKGPLTAHAGYPYLQYSSYPSVRTAFISTETSNLQM